MEKRQKKQIAVIIVLLGVLGTVWYLVLFGLPDGGPDPDVRPGGDRPGPELAEDAAEPVVNEDEPQKKTREVADDEAIRSLITEAARYLELHDIDTTAEALAKEEEKKLVGDFELSAIMWSEVNPLALINDRMVGIGDEVAGNVRIEDILARSVTLNVRIDDDTAETVTLRLEPR